MSASSTGIQTEINSGRREFLTKTVAAGGAIISAPTIADVVQADTASGFVEVRIEATVPDDTSVELVAHEDVHQTVGIDHSQSSTVPEGDNRIVFDEFTTVVNGGTTYSFELFLETEDDNVTPEVERVVIQLPDGPMQLPGFIHTFWGLATNMMVFLAGAITVSSLMGLLSKSLMVAAFAGFLAFVHITIEADVGLLTNILYVVLVMIFVGMAFMLYNTLIAGEERA